MALTISVENDKGEKIGGVVRFWDEHRKKKRIWGRILAI
jgi:hypothetical protein